MDKRIQDFNQRLSDLEAISKTHNEKINYVITCRCGNGIMFKAELPAYVNGKPVNINPKSDYTITE